MKWAKKTKIERALEMKPMKTENKIPEMVTDFFFWTTRKCFRSVCLVKGIFYPRIASAKFWNLIRNGRIIRKRLFPPNYFHGDLFAVACSTHSLWNVSTHHVLFSKGYVVFCLHSNKNMLLIIHKSWCSSCKGGEVIHKRIVFAHQFRLQ